MYRFCSRNTRYDAWMVQDCNQGEVFCSKLRFQLKNNDRILQDFSLGPFSKKICINSINILDYISIQQAANTCGGRSPSI